jgi:lipopolysaccharide export system permease protein
MSVPERGHAARAINLAPFGRHSRYMLASYLRHIFMVAAALMLIALTIDLWPQIPLLTAKPGLGVAFAIVRLALLRVCDLLPPFIPFATFLGVVWGEGVFTGSRERMLIWNSGRSPIQCLMPALAVGLVMGLALFVMDGFLRPAAIHVQIREVLGREGIRLDRSQSGGNHWLALPNGLLRAEIIYGPPVSLQNVTIYTMDSFGHLAEMDTAALAKPLPSGDQWQLLDGHYWNAAQAAMNNPAAQYDVGGTKEEIETTFSTRVIALHLDMLWLTNQGLSPQYLYMPELMSLAGAQIDAHDRDMYRTRLQGLFGEVPLTVAMALLAATLSLFYFAYRLPVVALILTLLAGYIAHFAARAFLLMGEFSYVRPFLAGWLVGILLLALVGAVLWLIERRRRITPA